MLEIIIATFIIIVLMTFLMFLMLKRLIRVLNDKSKIYFISKIQPFNELIEERSKELETINSKIKELKNVKQETSHDQINTLFDGYYELVNPPYKNETVFKEYKKINSKFNINNEVIIMDFIKDKISDDSNLEYHKLFRICNKLQFEDVYKILILEESKQIEVLKEILGNDELSVLEEYKQESFNILDFKSYVEELKIEKDPTIYVLVGEETTNYDYINNFIRTKYDEKICKGIMIIYKNKLYDYSLS